MARLKKNLPSGATSILSSDDAQRNHLTVIAIDFSFSQTLLYLFIFGSHPTEMLISKQCHGIPTMSKTIYLGVVLVSLLSFIYEPNADSGYRKSNSIPLLSYSKFLLWHEIESKELLSGGLTPFFSPSKNQEKMRKYENCWLRTRHGRNS